MKKYLLVQPDEDGNPTRWLDKGELECLFANPEEEYGVKRFLNDIEEESDPNYWAQGDALLLEVKIYKRS